MKKIWILILCCFMLSGCKKEVPQVSLADYNQFVEAINDQNEFQDESSYCDITLVMNSVEDHYRYDLFIGNVKERLENVRIVCKDDSQADYYPSIGVYDDPVNLDTYTKTSTLTYKGIHLSGITTKEEVEIHVLIEFKDSQGQLHQEYIKLSKGI
ncbi:MAG: hypothetical protein ACLRVU_03570 [Beduini sp.]|uniref:hypothetical protein n=1 Tax=Beduini sp. TaxID=1922300 RepID=UPI0039A38D22